MRKRLAILLLGLLFLWGAVPVPAQQVRVMQYNVHGNLGNTASINTAAAQALARIANYNQPDIITFNELDDNGTINTAAGLIAWVTNNVTYFGNKTNVTFWVDIGGGDGLERNGSISRYPISGAHTYSDGGNNYPNLRGMESFKVQLSGTNTLEIFHVHLKAGSTTTSCPRKQEEAGVDATNMMNWASTNIFPYVFTGDCNEDEDSDHDTYECATNATYHPITTLRQVGGLAEFRPRTLNGSWLTWSSTSQSIRFDYILPSTNRISLTASNTVACILTGIVFNSSVWGAQYTNAGTLNSVNDSSTASDHLCVQVTYSFPATGTNFTVTPTGTFTSSGAPGGPFSPASQAYTLTNTDVTPLFWSATNGASWLTISPTNGTLAVGWGTNITAFITNVAANAVLDGTYADTIVFSNTATGVSVARPVTLTVVSVPPTASFSGSPTNGLAPLAVTFTDTSTGGITNRFWDFGDGGTTNITTTSIDHAYAGGAYTVTLIASGPTGVSTDTMPNYITVTNITADADYLQDRFGVLAPTNSVAVLVVDTGTNGFVNPQSTFPLSLGATWGTEDKVVGLWDLTGCSGCGDGYLLGPTIVAYTNGIAPGQRLQLYWFPSLTLASNTVGITYYGKYTDTNSPPLDSSDEWTTPAAGTSAYLRFYTVSQGGSNPDAAGQATNLTAETLLANFTASPTYGLAPLAVTFTDTSTGTITDRFWNFGDSGTTNTTTNSVAHSYALGTYTVTLVVTGPDGVSTNTQVNYIAALTVFQNWQMQYFGSTNCATCGGAADFDGDGMSNTNEFLAGTDPTNSASSFRITSVRTVTGDVVVAWATGKGRTNVVQSSTGLPGGSYSTNFDDTSPWIILPTGSGDFTTNYPDPGAATNNLQRYYRIRLQP